MGPFFLYQSTKITNTYVLDVGQSPNFGSPVSPMASPRGGPISSQQNKDYRSSPHSSQSNIPVASELKVQEVESKETQEKGDDDAESAFYRDLRRQEEERQRRLAARRRIG